MAGRDPVPQQTAPECHRHEWGGFVVLILFNIALILPEIHSSPQGQLLPGSFSKASSGNGVKNPPGECRSTINDVQLLSQGRSSRRFF